MAVTQYIGSRYVPLFADPIEWSNQNTYEPLTIVLHEGNSYTSKQAVPKDIDIDNEEFWAETGNYNAQVELYRQETRAVATALVETNSDVDAIEAIIPTSEFGQTTVKGYVDEGLSTVSQDVTSAIEAVNEQIDTLSGKMFVKADVRNHGALEDVSTNDWAAIFAEIAAEGKVIYFPPGDWDLNGGVTIPQGIDCVCGSGARLFSSTPCNYLVRVSRTFTAIDGLTFDGLGRVNKLLLSEGVTEGNKLSPIIGCRFLNIGTGNYGIYNEYIGLHVVGCTFNTTYGGDQTSVYGGICIQSHTDNLITSCKFFRFDYALVAMGVNVSNCYFWARETEKGIALVPENFIADYSNAGNPYDSIFTNCEFDCIKTVCYNPRNLIVTACQFYWNDRDITSDCHLFMLSSNKNKLGSLTFSGNLIKFQEISYDIYMFSTDYIRQGIAQSAFLASYVSRDNVMTTSVYSMASLGKYHLLCGWVPINDFVRSGSRNIVSYLECDAFDTYNTARFSIIANVFRYDRIRASASNDQRAIYRFSPLRSGIDGSVKVFWNDTTPNEVIPFGSLAINSIEVEVSPLFNMPQNNYSNSDFDPTGYSSVDCQAVTFA